MLCMFWSYTAFFVSRGDELPGAFAAVPAGVPPDIGVAVTFVYVCPIHIRRAGRAFTLVLAYYPIRNRRKMGQAE